MYINLKVMQILEVLKICCLLFLHDNVFQSSQFIVNIIVLKAV